MKVEPTDIAGTLAFVPKLGLGVRATNVLLNMNLKSVGELKTLDERSLLEMANCGKKTAAEIMKVAARYEPPVEETSGKQMDLISALPVMERTPVTDLRLSVRAMSALERLKISTVGQLVSLSDRDLLRVANFGKKSLLEVQSKLAALRSRGFVLWPSEQPTDGGLSCHITRTARKLQRLRNASSLLCDDPRFGYLVREIGLEAKNAHEAADMIVSRRIDPVNPQPLMRRLIDLVRVIRAASRMTLETELWNLTDGLGSDRIRQIILNHLGWDGKPPRTLKAVGQQHNMTRERVRQICTRIDSVRSSKPFVPALDRALKIVAHSVPVLAEEIEDQLVKSRLTTGFSVESLIAVARELGREPRFSLEMLHGQRVVVSINSSGRLDRIDRLARGTVRHWGVGTVEDVAAAVGMALSFTKKLLCILPGFKWLDESSGWFWISDASRNSLLTQVSKILAASPTIDVGELRAGVGRHHRKKGFAPPRRVLLELCRQLPWCHVDGERIMAVVPPDPSEVLSDSEQIILKVLKEHGPVIQRPKFEQLCRDAGMNRHSFWIFLSYCPIICRYALGVYGLRGAEVPVGLVESLVPKRTARSKLLVDYGWMNDRNIRILYRVSKGMLANGIVSIPASFKGFLQGKFTLMAGDDSRIGTFVVKDDCGWGLGPFFSRRGGEPDDYLLLALDLSQRVAAVQIGDSSLTDQLVVSNPR